MASRLLSSVEYASLFVYSPRGPSSTATTSREVCFDLKSDRNRMVERVVGFMRDDTIAERFSRFLSRDVVLVPTPRSAPLVEGAHWPARRIAEELVSQDFGRRVLPCLERTHAVASSHRAQPGERPDVQAHYDSFRVAPELEQPHSITIIDDVLTRGDTLLAAASRVKEAYPNAEVRAFAVVRTMGLVPDIERMTEPTVGTLTLLANGRVDRQP